MRARRPAWGAAARPAGVAPAVTRRPAWSTICASPSTGTRRRRATACSTSPRFPRGAVRGSISALSADRGSVPWYTRVKGSRARGAGADPAPGPRRARPRASFQGAASMRMAAHDGVAPVLSILLGGLLGLVQFAIFFSDLPGAPALAPRVAAAASLAALSGLALGRLRPGA